MHPFGLNEQRDAPELAVERGALRSVQRASTDADRPGRCAVSGLLLMGMTLLLSGCPTTRSNIMPGNSIGGNNGYVDPAEESTDPWITEAAQEGRPDQVREVSNEAPWIRNLMMSPKAQSIEANLGFD